MSSTSFDGVEVGWLGHASLKLKDSGGLVMYVDPWSEVMELGKEKADIIVSTHDDRDHFDVKAINRLKKKSTILVCHPDSEEKVPDDVDYKLLEPGRMVRAHGQEVRGVQAYNVDKKMDSGELFHPKGTVMGVLFELDGVKFYFSSDTDPIPEMDELSDREIDVAFMPVGGTYTMDQEEALEAINKVEPDRIVPVHFGTIDATTADTEKFKRDVRKATDAEPVVL